MRGLCNTLKRLAPFLSSPVESWSQLGSREEVFLKVDGNYEGGNGSKETSSKGVNGAPRAGMYSSTCRAQKVLFEP